MYIMLRLKALKIKYLIATNSSHNAKLNEVKGEIPTVTNLATTAAVTTVENKIPNVSNLVKKTDWNTKICETEKKITDHNHDKYITIPEFNKFRAEFFAARLKQVNLACKNDIGNFVNKTDFDDKVKILNKKLLQIKQNLCLLKIS